MKKYASALLIFLPLSGFSATEQSLWMEPSSVLNAYHVTLSRQGVMQSNRSSAPRYGLTSVNPDQQQTEHTRYDVTYKGTPIWGHQITVHQRYHKQAKISGLLVHGVEQDIPDNQTILSASEATSLILSQYSTPIKAKEIQQIIYLDDNKMAHTAYLLSFYTQDPQTGLKNPHYIINAIDATVLKAWDEIKTMIEGEGPGGNAVALPYRDGAFQYGKTSNNMPSLGRFPMDHWGFWCYMQTPDYHVINLENAWLYEYQLEYLFPLNVSDEEKLHLNAAYEFCWPWTTVFKNTDDLGYSPVNEAYSPMNDAMYFVNETIEMYRSLGVEYPLGKTDLPLRVYTHIGGFDNAFAIPTLYFSGTQQIKSHQQIVLSNGVSYFTALTQSVIPHELSHNFTSLHSKLIYSGQSGGINESFSDMAAIALMDRIQKKHPFYWDGLDWSIGREATKNGKPLRSLEHPSSDGRSIEHAKYYTKNLDVHYSSGVFNRAFYLLAHQPGWSVEQAFQVMVDANRNYWESGTTFNQAACGVMQAAQDRGFSIKAVSDAFQEVGVSCAWQ